VGSGAPGAAAATGGRYFDGTAAARAHEGTYDPLLRDRLRAVTAELLAPFLDDARAPGR
jgi:hypothetical protein